MKHVLEILKSLMDPTLVIVSVVVLLLINSWVFSRIRLRAVHGKIIRRSIGTFIILVGIFIFILKR
ncbi:MAG: hypothetical protein ACOC0C_05440 [Bacteroidota bacterium]